MTKVGDHPRFLHSETCKHCGDIYKAIWHYGEFGGKREGWAERLCCKAAGKPFGEDPN